MQKAGVNNHDRVMISRMKKAEKSPEEVSRALRIKIEVVKEFWDNPMQFAPPSRLSNRSKPKS